jgi:hypothetical protein
MVQHIFRKFLTLKSSQFSITTFKVFLQLFYQFNEKAEKIKRKDWLGTSVYYASTVDIQGINNMYVTFGDILNAFLILRWTIITEKCANVLADAAMEALNSLFSYSEFGFSKSKNTKSREDYVSNCITKLKESAKSNDSLAVSRLSKLLRKYVLLFGEEIEKSIVYETEQEKVRYIFSSFFFLYFSLRSSNN